MQTLPESWIFLPNVVKICELHHFKVGAFLTQCIYTVTSVCEAVQHWSYSRHIMAHFEDERLKSIISSSVLNISSSAIRARTHWTDSRPQPSAVPRPPLMLRQLWDYVVLYMYEWCHTVQLIQICVYNNNNNVIIYKVYSVHRNALQ